MGPIVRAYQFFRDNWLPAYHLEKNRWVKAAADKSKPVSIFYGYDDLPGRNQLISGGLVKIQDLVTRFPNRADGADLIYLINSALPHFPPGFANLLLPTKAALIAKHGKKHDRPLILNQNGVAYPAWCPSGWRRINRINRSIMLMSDYVIYQSEFCKLASEKFLGVKPKNWEILHNPVNTKSLCPGKEKSKLPWQLLLTGSHWEFYRIETGVEALAEMENKNIDAVLNVAGIFRWGENERQSKDRIIELAKRYNVDQKINFMGSYTQDQVNDIFNQVHILLHTKYNDPCPRGVVEAMSCGVPVVYSASGGVPELIGPKAGIGIEAPLDWENNHPPSPHKISEAVERIICDYELFARGARNWAVENHDVDLWLGRHEKIFSSVLTKTIM